MLSEFHRTVRRGGGGAGRRMAIIASSACLAIVALALPDTDHGRGLVVAQAVAAGENSGTDAVPAQKKRFPGSESAVDEIADPVATDPGGSTAASSPSEADGQGSTTTHVIKEIAGVSDDTELSSEEELEAIRNGWGTWRTADGPESVIAQ